MKLEQISLHKTEGAVIRSKARWCEQGERRTRYFFNLEKRNHSNKYTAKLRVENRTLTSPDEILNEEHRYYKSLLLVQTQMILVLTYFSTDQPFQNCLHLQLTAATVF